MQKSSRIFITGANGFLGSHLIYSRRDEDESYFVLARGKNDVSPTERVLSAVKTASESYRTHFDKDLYTKRMSIVEGDITLPDLGLNPSTVQALSLQEIDQFWHFASCLNWEDEKAETIYKSNIEGVREALALASRLNVKRFIYMSTAYTAGKRAGIISEEMHPADRDFNNHYEKTKCHAEHIVSDFCESRQIEYVILRPSIVIGPMGTKRSGGTKTGLYGLLRQIYKVKDIIDKIPGGISVIGQPDSTPNIIPVDAVMEDINAILQQDVKTGAIYHLTSDYTPRTDTYLKVISDIVGIETIRCIPQFEGERSPIEKIIDQRVEFYNFYCKDEKIFQRSIKTRRRGVSDAELIGYVSEAYKEIKSEVPGKQFSSSLMPQPDGTELSVYQTGNSGQTTVLLVNAIGQPVDFWIPIAKAIRDDFHVLTWESRGVPNMNNKFNESECSFAAQMGDMHEVIKSSGSDHVHIVAWCTGAQLALRYCAMHPEKVKSMIIINGNYNFHNAPKTELEKNMRSVVPRIGKDKRYADLYYKTMYGSNEDAGNDAQTRKKQITNALFQTNPTLMHLTSIPFQSSESLYRYAKLIAAYYENDGVPEDCKAVETKTLVVTGMENLTIHRDGSFIAKSMLVNSELMCVENDDHYILYTNPSFINNVHEFLIHHEALSETKSAALAE